MKRGDIYWADLNPTIGSEINKKRPILIISNNANNRVSSTITVLPITSNVNNVYPFEVKLEAESGLSKASKVQCQQVRTISKQRITGTLIGSVDQSTIKQIDIALKLHLALNG